MTPDAGTPPPTRAPGLTAAEIATLVGGVLDTTGAGGGEAPKRQVRGVGPLDRAGPDQISFLADRRYASHAAATRAGVVLVAPEFSAVPTAGATRIVVRKPYDALVALLPRLYEPAGRPVGVHATAVVGANVTLGADVAIGPYAVVGNGATLGARAWIGPHCVVGDGVSIGADSHLVGHVYCYTGTSVGERLIVHAGARLGNDGFGYAFADGAHRKIPHVGRCIIESDVEIGANSCIDRGSVDDTVVGAGTKIDNLVHVAHNVRIGRLCLLMAHVGIAGSARIEDGAIIAGQAGVGGHATIGAQARIGAQAGVFGDVPAGETWSGYPARPHRESLRASAALLRLSGLLQRIERFLDRHE